MCGSRREPVSSGRDALLADAALMGGMLGRDHALLGAAGYLAAAPTVYQHFGMHVGPAELAVGALTCSGFALLPDIDEPSSTVSRKLGPISRAVSTFTKTVAGGHRQATHSLAFAALVGAGCWWALSWRPAAAIIVVAATLLVARLIVPLGFGRLFIVSWGLAAAAGWWMWHGQDSRAWLPYVAAAGVLAHLVGDMLTQEGVPPLWPIPLRVAVPLVGHTSSMRETLLGSALSIALVVLTWMRVLSPAASLVHLPRLA